MSKNSRIKQTILLYFKQVGRCHYCNCKMFPPGLVKFVDARLPDNYCTYEHVYSKFSPMRHLGLHQNVAACNKCNQERSQMENRFYGSLQRKKSAQGKQKCLNKK